MKPGTSHAAAMHDPRLQPPRVPALRGGIPDPAGAPVLQGTTRADAPITLSGRRALGAGNEEQGLSEIWIHPICSAADFTVRDFSADAITVSTGFVRRSSRALEERVCLARELGAVVWQWTARDGGLQLRLAWTIDLRRRADHDDGLVTALRWNTGERWLLVQTTDARVNALYCFDRDVAWNVDDVAPTTLRVEASVALEAGESITFATAASGPGSATLEETARVLEQPSTLTRGRLAAWNRIESERVRIRSPLADLNEAWRWALHRLDGFLVDVPTVGRSLVAGYAPSTASHCFRFSTRDAVWTALAALGVGDVQSARAVIEFLAGRLDAAGRVLRLYSIDGAAEYDAGESTQLFLLLVARYFAWSGDISFLRSHWPHVRRALTCADSSAATDGLAWASFVELAVAAEGIGEGEDARTLNTLAEQLRGSNSQALRAPLDLWPRVTGWASWTELLAGRTEAFTKQWLLHVRSGYERGRGAWVQPADGCTDHAWSTALAVAPLVYGLLGVEPDAARQRIQLRPALPRDWSFLDVDNLRFGESRFALRYQCQAAHYTFTLQPLHGVVPVRVIFEPAIPAAEIASITVDGQRAALNLRRSGDRWVCPLQVVLDHERTIVIEARAAETDGP